MKSKNSLFRDIYHLPYNMYNGSKLYNSCKGSKDLLQRMTLQKSLNVHRGCVNTLCWNSAGDCILSGSDDQCLVITNCFTYQVKAEHKTSHRANIFSAKYISDNCDKNVVSCSGDGIILFTDMNRAGESQNNQFNCHYGTTYEVQTLPADPHTFLSCGEDGTVRWFDLRQKTSCLKQDCKDDVMISCQGAVTALSVSSARPYQLAIGCSDSTVRIFDRRTLGTKATGGHSHGGSLRPLCSFCAPELANISYRITSLKFSPEGDDVLVSYSSDYLYLFGIKELSSNSTCRGMKLNTEAPCKAASSPRVAPPVKRLRLRGDWSDTGPNARPEREGGRRGEPIAQVRPTLQTTLMQRMTDVLYRMLNDPATRAALSGASDDAQAAAAAANAPVQEDNLVAEEDDWEDGASGNNVATREMESEAAATAGVVAAVAAVVAVASIENDGREPDPPALSSLTLQPSGLPGDQALSPPTAPERPQFISNLQDRLSTMRDGFVERHNSEPAVSLSFSEVGSTAGTISLGIGNEPGRSQQPASESQASTSQNNDIASSSSSSSSSNQPQASANFRPVARDEADTYGDSDDEEANDSHMGGPDMMGSQRSSRPIEEHMEKAMAALRGDKKECFEDPNTPKPTVKQKYTGHRNARTMIKEASFWGENFVMSGSDCGHVFIWERETGKLAMLLEADKHVVNCLQPHPYLPLLATSGIDYDVKLWAPMAQDSCFDPVLSDVLTQRNEIMLEETRDTITVPASFMIRMLACLNQIRRGGRTRPRNSRQQEGDDV